MATEILAPDIEQELVAAWPALPADQRRLWFRVLDALLPPDAPLLETLEDLEAQCFAEAAQAARAADGSDVIPLERALAELGYNPS